jgi:signal transduction histidine kinase/ligand-binding sensor domain-containing protein
LKKTAKIFIALSIHKTILLAILFFVSFITQAQKIERYNTFSYSVNDGLLQSTIGDIAVDKNNFCWISFPNGIQKFDGEKFTIIPIQSGLPDDKLVHFFTCFNGDLLLSHSQGISKYTIVNNRFQQIYTNPILAKNTIVFIGEDEGLIYFYTETGHIVGIDAKTYKPIVEAKTNLPLYPSQSEYQPKFSTNIINHKVAVNLNSTLYLWNLKEQKLIATSMTLPDMSIFFLHLKTENEVLYYSSKINNALLNHNFTINKSYPIVVKGKDNKPISRCHLLSFKNKLLVGFNNQLFETDISLATLKTELVDFQNQPIAGVATIANIKEDNFGNLYIQTINGGVKKVIGNNYPIKYYSSLKKEENMIVSILPDKKDNRILAGAVGNGLLVFDTLQRLIKHIKTLPNSNTPFSPNCIIKNNQENYLLFNIGEKNAWLLKSDLSAMTPLPISSSLPENKKRIDYFGNFLFQNQQEAITQSQGKFYKINLGTNSIVQQEVSTAYVMGGLLHHNFIITHGNDELIFLDASTFAEIKKVSFKNTGYVRCFAHDNKNNIFIGSNNGIYQIDENGKILQHLNKENGLPDDCIYAIAFDENNDLWCSTNKGIFKINKDNSILQLKKEDGLQENEFNTNVLAKTSDGEFFFGGVNGISSFYPSSINNIKDSVQLICTQIKVNNKVHFVDTAAWNVSNFNLPHNQNLLSFDFIAMGNNNPDQYIYQYKMEGIDEQWLQNEGSQTVRYFLPPGKYTFKIYASRFFDKDAKALKEISITIHPPFWKTWWFKAAVGLLFITGLFYGVNRYNQKKYNKKLTDVANEYKIQLERERISRDLHDSIGAYANAVLYKTELLENENNIPVRDELMSDLKFASKDIITSLRETVWALKKDNYSGEDCLVRIRNFIQPLSRYYKNIQFKIEGDVPPDLNFHSTKALNLVRIVQEAVSNSIKHADAKNIYISNSTESGQWKIIVKDDGKGFDYTVAIKTDAGNGLNNMQRRALDSSFEFSIVSNAGKQTIITIIT